MSRNPGCVLLDMADGKPPCMLMSNTSGMRVFFSTNTRKKVKASRVRSFVSADLRKMYQPDLGRTQGATLSAHRPPNLPPATDSYRLTTAVANLRIDLYGRAADSRHRGAASVCALANAPPRRVERHNVSTHSECVSELKEA